jgi:hypothetical protein
MVPRFQREGVVADNVVLLRPKERQILDPYADLQRRRTDMINAWTAWLATQPHAADVLQEIDGTTGAMRSLADLIGAQTRGSE